MSLKFLTRQNSSPFAVHSSVQCPSSLSTNYVLPPLQIDLDRLLYIESPQEEFIHQHFENVEENCSRVMEMENRAQ